MQRFCVCDGSGHRETLVDVTDPAALAGVQTEFDRLIGAGYAAFAAEVDGAEGGGPPSRRLNAYDPTAGEIVLTPALVGG